MEKHLGQDIKNRIDRIAFLKDNCDSVEKKGYMKPFTKDEISQMKNSLSETSIQINDIELEKKRDALNHKLALKPLQEEQSTLLSNLKKKAEFVEEICYKFIDTEKKEVGFYNAEGDLIESRPAYSDELQINMMQLNRTGTGN